LHRSSAFFCIIALRRYCAAKRGKKLFLAHAEITLCGAPDQSLTQMRQFGAEDEEKTKKAALAAFFDIACKLACSDLCLGTDGTKLLTELLDATSGVDDLVLTGVERMRFGRNFDLHEWVLLAFEFGCFACADSRAGDEFEVVRHVVEQNFAVIWMDALLHGLPQK